MTAPTPSKPQVTIFADASHDGPTGAAGWGAWIKADGRDSVIHGAAMKGTFTDASTPELCALANALTLARLNQLLPEAGIVMLQSDCLYALQVIRKHIQGTEDRPARGGLAVVSLRKAKLTPIRWVAVDVIKEVIVATRIKLITRHVKGHAAGDGRQWVNRAVDELARRNMRVRRAAIREVERRTRHCGMEACSP